ncbi:hypothetical protein HY501_03075 [Candidatus Woesearchaeota archaeon]|nr:hypothetical protein [Candidatus Woesearchaeota archaeon]
MQKKGQAEVWQLFGVTELIVGFMILTFFLVFVLTYTTASHYNKEYLQKDLTLASFSLLASPEKAIYRYPVNKAYEVSIGDTISVDSSSRFAVFKETYLLEFSSSPAEGLKVRKI